MKKKRAAALALAAVMAVPAWSGSAFAQEEAPDFGEPVEMELFVNFPWYPTMEWAGPVCEEIERQTGVKLKITVAADEQQLPVLIAGGDLPDIVFAEYKDIKRLSDPNLCWAWDELIEQYAPDFEVEEERRDAYTVADGHFYTMCDLYSNQELWDAEEYAIPFDGGICYREDILEELGSPEINSFEDLEDVFAQVKEKYPDMIPVIMSYDRIGTWVSNQMGLMNPIISRFVRNENGSYQYYINQEGRLDYYKRMNSWYRNGYIQAENYTHTSLDDALAYVYSGQAFAYMKETKSAEEIQPMIIANGGEHSYVQQINNVTDHAAFYDSCAGWGGCFISRKNPNPEAAIRLMRYLFSEEGMRTSYWGIEGEHWTMNEAGYPEFSYNPDDWNYTTSEGVRWWGNVAADAVVQGVFLYSPDKPQTFEAGKKVKESKVYDANLAKLVPDADSQESAILAKLTEMVANEEAKCYLAASEEECEAAYENMLALAEQIGVAQLESWANETVG